MTIARMSQDGLEAVAFVVAHLHGDTIIVLGHS